MVVSSARRPTDPNEETLRWLQRVELAKAVYEKPLKVNILILLSIAVAPGSGSIG